MGEIVPSQQGAIDQVTVTMSPQHFKSFVRSLDETLVAYEKAFGALSISDSDTAPQRNAEQILEIIEQVRTKAKAYQTLPSSTEPPQPEKRSRSSSRKKEH